MSTEAVAVARVASSAANNNLTLAKSAPGYLRGFKVNNNNAAVRYLKFVDAAATGDVTVGTTAVLDSTAIPGNAAGAGVVYNFPGAGVLFRTGICWYMVTEAADNGTTGISAGESSIAVFYS